MLYGGIEAGGSKFRCAIGEPGGRLVQQATYATTEPGQTMAAVLGFFAAGPDICALGVSSFGPLGIDPTAPNYGQILDTPKVAWQNVSLALALKPLDVPLMFQTDVVGAALAEWYLGGHFLPLDRPGSLPLDRPGGLPLDRPGGLPLDRPGDLSGDRPGGPIEDDPGGHSQARSLAYITVGTGIGMGLLVDGQSLPMAQHAEFGHQFVQRHSGDNFPGCCVYHKDCLEGLASGPAIAERWQVAAVDIHDQAAWDMEAFYLAQACVNLIRTTGVGLIILAGGVLQRQKLLAHVQQQAEILLADYYLPAGNIAQMIVAPTLGQDSGLLGALLGALLSASRSVSQVTENAAKT